MKKWLLAFGVAALLAVLMFRVTTAPRYLNLTEEEIRSRVRVGMSQQEVSAALGEPTWTGDLQKSKAQSWTYFNSIQGSTTLFRPLKISVIFENGVVAGCMTEMPP